MKHAVISDCERYRYLLQRRWAWNTHSLVVVMLNPSTADHQVDDPTIRRVTGLAKRDGFGGVTVLNLFAYRATDPRQLATVADPVGRDNDTHLREWLRVMVAVGQPVLAAWGAAEFAKSRAIEVVHMVPKVRWVCLGTTKAGAPRHPLYTRADQPMAPYVPQEGKEASDG